MSNKQPVEALEPWDREPDPCWSCGGDAEARDDIHVRCIDSKGVNCEVTNHWFTRKTWNTRSRSLSAATGDERRRLADLIRLTGKETFGEAMVAIREWRFIDRETAAWNRAIQVAKSQLMAKKPANEPFNAATQDVIDALETEKAKWLKR